MDVKVFFEDHDLILCEKPIGVLSQGDESHAESMTDIILSHEASRGEEPYVGVVHRLDRNVGGVMVYAKTQGAAAKLSAMVGDKEKFVKEYLAAVHGVPNEPEGVWTDYLYKAPYDSKVHVFSEKRKGAKEASLFYRVLQTKNDVSLVYVRLYTGRTHQIRAQFAYHNTPLVGDKKYGAADSSRVIGLHAFRLAFPHPITGEILRAVSAPERDFPFPINLSLESIEEAE